MIGARRVGRGPHRVIALHGWFGSSAGWGSLPQYLDGDLATWVFPDVRGYGARRREVGALRTAEVAAEALALADAQGWDAVTLVGHGMGAKFAVRILAEAPHRVRRLIAIGGVPAGRVTFDTTTDGLFARAAQDRGSRFALVDLSTSHRLTTAAVDHLVQHSVHVTNPPAVAAALAAWAGEDISAEAGTVAAVVPVTCVVGQHDPFFGASLARSTWLRTFPGATVVELPAAGHFPMHETPTALVAAVEGALLADGRGA